MFSKEKLHLIPPSVMDIVANVENKSNREHVRENYATRLLAMKDYIDEKVGEYYTRRAIEENSQRRRK